MPIIARSFKYLQKNMQIDDDEFLNLVANHEENGTNESTSVFVKETLLFSPIFRNIFPQFYVKLHKSIRNIRQLSLQDDGDQYLALQEQDSQFGVFSDDEMLFDDETPKESPEAPSKLEKIQVIVRNTSLLVEGLQFPFNSAVRSSTIIKGIRNDDSQEEDSLLVSLTSGFLLLIRIFYVPQNFGDDDFDENFQGKMMVFKPFVVQWWDTSSSVNIPPLVSTGYILTSHVGGLAAVSSSASGAFRIYNCNHTDKGVIFNPHCTVPVDGCILHSCFAYPLQGSLLTNHVMLLNMVLSNDRRLFLNLYSWTTTELISDSLTKSTMPLEGGFPLPVFVTPLRHNGSFLFAFPKELYIISVHDITSADYNFKKYKYDGGFPTNFFYPESPIFNIEEDNYDEVLISTDNGSIISVLIKNDTIISMKPIIRISDPISVFCIEKRENGFDLTYGSNSGLNRKLFIEELLPNDTYIQSIPYSLSLLVDNYKNWAPLLDVQVIDAFKSKNTFKNCEQELWCISGTDKRARLSQLRSAYCITKLGDPYPSLRKVEDMHLLLIGDAFYICCSLPFETIFLELQQTDNEPELVEIAEAAIDDTYSTIKMQTVTDELCVQVTSSSIVLTSIEDEVARKDYPIDAILFADVFDQVILTVSQAKEFSVVELTEIIILEDAIDSDSSMASQEEYPGVKIEVIKTIPIDFQVSFAKFIETEGKQSVVLGSFDGSLHFYDIHLSQVFLISLFDFFSMDEVEIDPMQLVPNDAVINRDSQHLIIGTKDGYLFYFKPNGSGFEFVKRFVLGDTEVKLSKCVNTNIVFVVCGSLWLIDFDKVSIPEIVLLEEKNDKPVKSILLLETNEKKGEISMLIVRDEGVSVTSVQLFKSPNVRQINLGDSAKKFVYLPYLSIFAVLSKSKETNSRLRYVDRKTFRLLAHSEFNSKSIKFGDGDSLFSPDEIPICGKIWSLDKLGKTSKKLLVGCSKQGDTMGTFKVLDISRLITTDNKPMIRVTLLNAFEHKDPITSIEQVENTILFSSGKSIYSTVYNLKERRLNPIVPLVTLTSDITSLNVQEDSIVGVTTKLDSIYQFEFISSATYDQCLTLRARDHSPKAIMNHVMFDDQVIATDKVHSDIIIMNRTNKSFQTKSKFKTIGIPSVFKGNFNLFWSDNEDDGAVIVSIDGQVTYLKQINDQSVIFRDLSKLIPLKKGEKKLSTNWWDAQFMDRVTGKGFKSTNKPYFRFKDNKEGLIDYDLHEISRFCSSHSAL